MDRSMYLISCFPKPPFYECLLEYSSCSVALQYTYCKFPFSSGSMQYIVCNSMQQDYSFCLIGFMRVGDVICDPISSLHSIQQQTKSGFPFWFLKDFQSYLLLIFAIYVDRSNLVKLRVTPQILQLSLRPTLY